MNSIEKSGMEVQLTSLTEVLIIILFALLLFNYSSLDKVDIKEREVQELNLKIEKLETDMEVQAKAQSKKIRELKKELKEAKQTIDIVKRYLVPNISPTEVELEDLIMILASQVANGDGEGPSQETVILRLEKQIVALNARVKELEANLDTEGSGTDKPRCDIPGLVSQYNQIATVEVFPGFYKVSGNWDHITERTNVALVPGLLALENNSLSRSEFKKAAAKVFSWSKKQPEECRFRVDLKVSEATKGLITSEGLKRISLVTQYFYQRTVN
jgi:outer membrane murein-binding lipoprotein Lpp